jgi:uncharacterized membrane protein YphA (DoxX/SURF4 family)
MREQTLIVYLVPLRLFSGWVFFMAALQKLAGGWLDHPRLYGVVVDWMRTGKPYGFFLPILRLVTSFPTLFTWLLVLSELLIGAALLAGLFTRAAALWGLLLMILILFGRGDGIGPNPTSPFVAILLTLALTHTGRTLGLDAALSDKVPRWLT